MGLDQTAAYTSLTVNDIRVNVSRDMVFAPLLELLVKIPLSHNPPLVCCSANVVKAACQMHYMM